MDPASVAGCCWATEREGELGTTDVLIRLEVGDDLGDVQLSAKCSAGKFDRLGAGHMTPAAVATTHRPWKLGGSEMALTTLRGCDRWQPIHLYIQKEMQRLLIAASPSRVPEALRQPAGSVTRSARGHRHKKRNRDEKRGQNTGWNRLQRSWIQKNRWTLDRGNLPVLGRRDMQCFGRGWSGEGHVTRRPSLKESKGGRGSRPLMTGEGERMGYGKVHKNDNEMVVYRRWTCSSRSRAGRTRE